MVNDELYFKDEDVCVVSDEYDDKSFVMLKFHASLFQKQEQYFVVYGKRGYINMFSFLDDYETYFYDEENDLKYILVDIEQVFKKENFSLRIFDDLDTS